MGNSPSICYICESYVPPEKLATAYGETFHERCIQDLIRCPKCTKNAYNINDNDCMYCGHTVFICSVCGEGVTEGVITNGDPVCGGCHDISGEPVEETAEVEKNDENIPIDEITEEIATE